MWDEKAEVELRGAKTVLDIARARELAHHYRWRASKLNPREYGEKLQMEQRVSVQEISDEALVEQLAKYGFHVPPLGAADARTAVTFSLSPD